MQVGEEVERALAKFAPPKAGVRYADGCHVDLSYLSRAFECTNLLLKSIDICRTGFEFNCDGDVW